ncbi:MAG: hypothetical protein Q8O55_11435 [Dehalococcoidales bacterium]|nr:hypothetical protein [Dehalococcoidales bacterium]
MPSKGQTCLTCNANCCHGIVGYKYTPEAFEKVTALVESGATTWSKKKDAGVYSHRELLGWGMVEIELPYQEKGCGYQTEDGLCGKERHKPRLCRTYWCHGKHWSPKLEHN